MCKLKIALLLVFASSQICGSQIFGGGGGLNRPQALPRGGILNPDGAQFGGGILGGAGIGPGGREGILGHGQGIGPGGLRPPHPQAQQPRFHQPPQRQQDKGQRVRMGPIVFDSDNLEFDDNDDYTRDHETEYSRPRLGLDLSNLFTPLVNFMKFMGKSLESVFALLEKQANLLLGRKTSQNGSVSVTIVIIISWLVMGMVVFALAQYSTLRRMNQEEEEEEAAAAAALVRSQLATPPVLQTTPPTPSPQNGGTILSPVVKTQTTAPNSSISSPKSIWLPSVGALQLSDSSILKRRESAKRKRKAKQNSCNRSRIRHRSSNVDHATVSWIEMGLERVQSEEDVRANALKKWQGFLKQHVMQTLQQDGFQIEFQELLNSDLPQLSNVDVEMCDEENLIVTMDIEASFEAQLSILYSEDDVESSNNLKMRIPRLATRVEFKLPRNALDETPLHVRQTGHVSVDVELMTSTHCESCCLVQQIISVAITDALKNVDCDLPPLEDLCGQTQDSDEGVFIETPSSYSFPSPSPYQKESQVSEDQLCVTLLKASLEKKQRPPSLQMKDDSKVSQDQYRPYVILEMDHPAQRYHTSEIPNKRNGSNGSLDFRWTKENPFQFHVSREKSFELLVELWNDETNQESFTVCRRDENLSPANLGHRLLGVCLISVQDLISCTSQTHVVSLQGRPFSEDEETKGTLSLQFHYVPDTSQDCGTSTPIQPSSLMPVTFNGVHKSLEMKQSNDDSGQSVFITNATYTMSKDLPNKDKAFGRKSCSHVNSVALAAVRDLQTQRNLRLGTPPATKSTLLIRSVQKTGVVKPLRSPDTLTSNCDTSSEGSISKSELPPIKQPKVEESTPPLRPSGSPQTPKKEKRPKRKGFLSILRKRLSSKRIGGSRESCSMPSHELSSSIVEEDEELANSANASDSISSCSGRSSCCSEQSYHLYSWKGPMSASWESLKSVSNSNLAVPSSLQDADASSLSDASGFSISVVSNSVANVTATSSGTKFPTALVLETIEENETVYYLIPKHLAKKGRLKKKGTKLHVCQDHMFIAKHIKSGGNCSVCQKKMSGRLGKKMYSCRDCELTCHKDCFDKTQESCSKSTLSSLELLRGSTLFKKKGP